MPYRKQSIFRISSEREFMAMLFHMVKKEQNSILNKIVRLCFTGRLDEKREGVKFAKIPRDHKPNVLQMTYFKLFNKKVDFNYLFIKNCLFLELNFSKSNEKSKNTFL